MARSKTTSGRGQTIVRNPTPMPERPRFEGDNPRFNIPAPGTYMPPMLPFDPNLGQPPPESFGIGNTLMPPDPYASPYRNDPYSYLPNEPEPYVYNPTATGNRIGSITNNPFNPNYGRTGGPNRGGGNNPIYNNPMNNMGNTNRVPTAARVPVAPPPGYRPGIDPEWNYFPNSNPPATTMGQYPYGITPPANLPNFGNALAGVEDFDFSNLDLSNLDLSGLGFSQPSTPSVQQPAMPQIAQPTMPEIDYDLLASKFNFPSQPAFEMPDYSDLSERLSGIETGLGGLQNRFQNLQVPQFDIPEINYDLLADKVNMPFFEMPDYTKQFENLQTGLGGLGQQIGGLQTPSFEVPDFDYDLLAGNIAGNMPSFEMPDYSQQFENLQTGLGGLGTQLGNFQMPSFEMPDYSQQFSDIQQGLGGLGQQIGNMPSYEMPNYNQQFENLQQQIGNIGYGGPSLQDIQGMMPSYDPYNPMLGPSDKPIGFAKGGSIRYQEGEGIAGLGDDAEMTEGNQQLIEATIMAIQGMAPDQATADAIINQFIGLYGQEAFMALREQVLNPDGGAQTQGMIEGFGGGMDDFVQGVAGNQDRIAASPGEYIVPADVVSQLGDGNSTEGSRKLDGMLERTRMAKTGTIEQAPPIDSRRVLPA